jgi:L-alanine-DL-glutamate epimerase-like enolase superfamily enzyme
MNLKRGVSVSKLVNILPGFYRITLPAALSDSMHGRMLAFELNTVRVHDAEGADGAGYTFTCGRNGAAVHALLERDFGDLVLGQDGDRIEWLWNKLWWGLHYGGRGGPTVLALSAFDMALWDLKAKRLNQPLWRLLGGNDPNVLCYAGVG